MLVGASAASAATEFGSHCIGNRAEEGQSYAVIQLSQGGVPTAAPASGVVTSWKIRLVGVPFALPQQLKVFRPTGNPSQFQVVGESETANVVSGENTFATRIPIQTGDRIGLFANSQFGALFCAETPETESPGNSIGIISGNPTTGSTATLAESAPETLVPVSAVIEPDADNDGYGDETQDKCPQNASTQSPCPVIALSASAVAKKGLATMLITSSSQASVTVAGTAKLGKGKSATLNGGTQIITPGVIAKFTLLFPKALKAKLKQLSRKRFLFLNLTATAPNVVGAPTVTSLKVKLKGQAKPKPKHRAKPKAQA
jgi:hypothetical protein